MEDKGLVVIVGRANVGKSSLFNRLIGRRQTIVDSTSGITRDRVYAHVSWEEKVFEIADTGGLLSEIKNNLSGLVLEQTKKAIKEAGLILFVVDAKTGLVQQDLQIAEFLRTFNKKFFLIVNKVDNLKKIADSSEFYELGIEKTFFVSSLHGLNIDELQEEICRIFEFNKLTQKEDESALKISIIGRPNVGKSSFLNKLLNEERVIVDSLPGTTRDSIDTHFLMGNDKYIFIDTGGIRRHKKTHQELDIYTRSRTIEAINRSHVCLVLVDAKDGILRDDLHIFSLVQEAEKCCVIAINKCDLVKLKLADCQTTIHSKAPFMDYAFALLCSAKNGKNISQAVTLAQKAWQNSKKWIVQDKLKDALQKMLDDFPQLNCAGHLKIYEFIQIRNCPPTFLFVVNKPKLVKSSFLRYIEGRMRQFYDFKGAHLKIIVKNGAHPG